jgi:hypothetical protein
MPLIAYLHARLAELRDDGERGDSPVPTAVIILGLVFVAMAVTAAAWAAAESWMNTIPAPVSPGGP